MYLKKPYLGEKEIQDITGFSGKYLSTFHGAVPALNFMPILGDHLQKACFPLTVFTFSAALFDKKPDCVELFCTSDSTATSITKNLWE